MSTATYTVVGMTCDHCVQSVTKEVKQIPGVSEVDVNLASGAVTVTFDVPPATRSTATSVTPGTARSSPSTDAAQWPQVMPVTS